jgi:hypothetical protein
VSRRGFFCRIVDAFPALELTVPQEPDQVAMAAVPTPTPRPQGARKENVNPQLPAHNPKTEPDFIKFMKDVKSELGALRTLLTKLEALITRKRKADDRPNDKQGKTHAGLAQGKNRKAQKGAAASTATRLMPASYINSSASEESEEEVHFANLAQTYEHFPNFDRVESIVGPFRRNVVQSAKPKPSREDYFGPSASRLSLKKRPDLSAELYRQLEEANKVQAMDMSPQHALVSRTAALDIYAPVMSLDGPAPLQSVSVDLRHHSPLLRRDTGITTPSEHSDDDVPELESFSEDEEEIARMRARTSTTSAGGAPAAITIDRVRTRRQVLIDSYNYPDARLLSEDDADGSEAVAKTTEALYDHAVVPEPAPRAPSRNIRKGGNNIGKMIGTATMVSKRSQRSGVMNRNNASCDDMPSRRRRSSFNTARSAGSSPTTARAAGEDDPQANIVDAAPTTLVSFGHDGDM